MSVPDQRALIAHVYAQGGHDLKTKEGAGKFTEAAAAALFRLDENFGHLRKPPNRTHVVGPDGNRHAVDVVLYRKTGQIVDIIRDAGEPGAGLSWGEGEEGEYTEDDWYAPVEAPPVEEEEEEDEPPVSDDVVLAALAALSDQQAVLVSKIDALDQAVAEVDRRLTQLRFPNYHAEGTIALPRYLGGNVAFGVTLTPEN